MIVQELDEFDEVLFYMTGTYQVGYSINREFRFPIIYSGCRCIGAYGVSYNKRALFVFKTYERCQGYFVRKTNWLRILDENDQ
jgi:hypothetical protein